MRKSVIVSVIVAAALPLAACGSAAGGGGSGSPSGGEVKIGVPNPFTDAAAVYGQEAKTGAELAVQQINARDGKCVGGQPVTLLFEDDKGTPEGGVTAVQKLMTREKVNVIVGGSNSSVVLAEASVTKDQIVQINTAAQADAITANGGSMLFQVNNTVTQNGGAFNKYITDKLKPSSLVYMGEDTAFNAGVLETLKSDLSASGIKILDTAKYQSDTKDFTPILNKLKSAGADALYISDAFPARAATLLQQVKQVGGFGTILISPGVVTQGYIDAAGSNIAGAITGDIYSPKIDTKANKAFVEAFQADNPGKTPGKVELVNYEGILAACDGMTKAGSSTDQKAIAKAIASLSIETPRGTLKFGDKGRATAPSFFVQRVEGGNLKVIDEVK